MSGSQGQWDAKVLLEVFCRVDPGFGSIHPVARFDFLWYTDPDTKEVYSNVLSDWYYEDEYTFVTCLKEGVTFSNGEVATSDDVLYSGTCYIDAKLSLAMDMGSLNTTKSYCRDELTTVLYMMNLGD
jgi:ABC-type transport system substrate-binding protein